MIVVGEILHLQGSFQGALGLDNCGRYRCLYLTEEDSIRWKYCLVNQKLFHFFGSLPRISQFGPTEDEIQYSKPSEKINYVSPRVQKCTEESFSKCKEMYRKNYFESHLGG